MTRKKSIQMGLPFLFESIAESMWRAMGWACDGKSNAVINSLKKVCRRRSTRWWHSLQTEVMERDCESHTRWKHKRRWRNRGHVWDKIAMDWASKEDWMRARERKSTLDDKYQFVTFVLDSMKLSIVHRKKKSKGIGKKVEDKTPADLGPADTTPTLA